MKPHHTLMSWILSMLALIVASSGCSNKGLCDVHPHLPSFKVSFDWSCDTTARPESMIAWFYPITLDPSEIEARSADGRGSITGSTGTGMTPRYFEFSDINGDSISIMPGTYRIICYNSDTDGVQFRNTDDFFTHEAFTRPGNIFETIFGSGAQPATQRGQSIGQQECYINPDMMWGCDTVYAEVTAGGSITLTPRPLVSRYSVTATNVSNVKYVRQLCASLSSMSSSMRLARSRASEEPATVPALATHDAVSTITTTFLTFGEPAEAHDAHVFTLYIWLADGTLSTYKWDVTEQMHSATKPGGGSGGGGGTIECHISIDHLELPKPITNGSGFHPSVDGWGEGGEENLEM